MEFLAVRNQRFADKETSERFIHSKELFLVSQETSEQQSVPAHLYPQILILKNFESLHIILVQKSEKTFKMSFWADFGRESEKTLTLK